MEMGTKIRKLAGTLIAAALLVTVTGCPQGNGGTEEVSVEKKEFKQQVRSLSGELTVVVAEDGKVEGIFSRGGKEYKGQGTVAAGKVELTLAADGKAAYSFKGEYDKGKKEFTVAKFGELGGTLWTVRFGKDNSMHLFYHGEVVVARYGLRNENYKVTVAVKNDSAVSVLFDRIIKTGESSSTDESDRKRAHFEFDGKLQGSEVMAKVRLEGENFEFRTILYEDGSLRETKLLGERGYEGDIETVEGVLYEVKGAKQSGEVKDAAMRFNGTVQLTMYLSEKALLRAEKQKAKEENHVATLKGSAKAKYVYDYKKLPVGKLFVRYYDLTEGNEAIMHESWVPVTMGMYEGVEYEKYVFNPTPSTRAPNFGDFGGATNVIWLKRTDASNGLHSTELLDKERFVLVLSGKEWYNKTSGFSKGKVYFGRVGTLEAKVLTEAGKKKIMVDYGKSVKNGLVDITSGLKVIRK